MVESAIAPRHLIALLAVLLPVPPAFADSAPYLVKDLYPGQAPSGPHRLTAYKGALYFSAGDDTGFGLWRSDGRDITSFKRTDAGGEFAVAGDTLFFTAHETATGVELWGSDGGAPALVRDIEPGDVSSGPRSLTAVGSTLYFDGFTSAGGRALWRSDGTPAGTEQVKSFAVNQPLRLLTAVGSLLYFVADDGVHGRELWRSDGTPAGTFMVRDIDPQGGSSPTMLTPFGSELVFAATGPEGTELWRSDGTTASLIEDINPGLDHSSPRHASALDGWLYFSAVDARGRELWRANGTDAELVADILPGEGSSDPRWITAVGPNVLFEAADATHGRELWRSNGTTTALVRDINPTGDAKVAPTADDPSEHLAVAGTAAYFQADDGTAGVELWRSDGTEATLAGDIEPGPDSSQPEEMTAAGDRLFFAAGQHTTGTELWSLVLGPSADLAVALTGNPARPRIGDQVTLTATVRNLGPEPTAGVRVGVDLPAGVTLVSAPGSFAAGVWTVGALGAGATATLTLTVRVDGSSPVISARVLAPDLTDPVAANDVATLTLAPPAIVVGGACTLVLAIIAANTDAPAGECPGGSGADRIELGAASVHSYTTAHEVLDGATALPSITSDITVAGHGAVIRRAAGDIRLFRVGAGGTLTLRQVTVRGGSSSVRGGGLLVSGGSATVEDSRLEGNIAPSGGAIASVGGDVTLIRSVVTDNTAAFGGGILADGGSLKLVDSTISANRATHPSATTFGGGVYANAALTVAGGTIAANAAQAGGGLVSLETATLTNTTVSANTASIGFAGIDNRGVMTVTASQIVNNVAQSIGGGIGNLFSGTGSLRLTRTTVSGNRANGGEGGGLESWGEAIIESSTFSANAVENRGPLQIRSSTLVGGALVNTGTAVVTGSIVPTCVGAVTDGGGNTGCGVDPLLGPLADNGGPTRTHAPLPGSPAIDAAAACPALDQRGIARPLDGNGDGVARCDAGAVEAPAAAAIAAPVPGPPTVIFEPPVSRPATGITGLRLTLTVSGSTIRLGTAKNPPTAFTTQTLTTTRAGASAVLARGSTRIPAGGKRRLTLKLTKAGKRQLKRKTLRLRLRIVATGPDGARATITRTVKVKRKR
ncbi:MAG TPA: ELWxxDGT repeat protein [Solirubrobacter sp.]|nr:ELWxxDGT repeat protein [Solirubrobacter sp.]